jgi:hypothetical protein
LVTVEQPGKVGAHLFEVARGKQASFAIGSQLTFGRASEAGEVSHCDDGSDGDGTLAVCHPPLRSISVAANIFSRTNVKSVGPDRQGKAGGVSGDGAQ